MNTSKDVQEPQGNNANRVLVRVYYSALKYDNKTHYKDYECDSVTEALEMFQKDKENCPSFKTTGAREIEERWWETHDDYYERADPPKNPPPATQYRTGYPKSVRVITDQPEDRWWKFW